jgi:hypothetical protein
VDPRKGIIGQNCFNGGSRTSMVELPQSMDSGKSAYVLQLIPNIV